MLRINTPGGLDTSMREINSAILASPVPVAIFVAPNGARAASAGTYIAYASAIAAMAPGTNIGAATPIQIGGSSFFPSGRPDQEKGKAGESADTPMRKAVNDAVAYIRSLAEINGRNADWAEDAVRSAASIPASEAIKLHVVDVIADDVPDLLRKIDGRIVVVAGKSERLTTAGLDLATIAPDWADRAPCRNHQSERRFHPPADRRLWNDLRVLQPRGGRSRPDRRDQFARGALRAQPVANQLCRCGAGVARHRAHDR